MYTNSLNRRQSIGRAGIVASTALAGTAFTTSAIAEEGSGIGCTYPDSLVWNAAYDVVVIGFGIAGGIAADFAADAGAKVLLIDSAPEGHEGGNSRYAGGAAFYTHDKEAALEYCKKLAWKMEYDDEVLDVYTTGLANMKDFFDNFFGIESVTWKDNINNPSYTSVKATLPEYPNYSNGEAFDYVTTKDATFDAATWRRVRNTVKDRSDQITVWLESPATALIQDPETKTIVGVKIEHDGGTAMVRATNGVVLTCGGFENNQTMIQNYFGAAYLCPLGSTYNVGDGVRMASEVGAQLWHMDNYECYGMLAGNSLHINQADHRARLISWGNIANGSIIAVGDDGGRFMREDESSRHGHLYTNGVWRIPPVQYSPHLVYDQTKYDWFMDNFDTLANTEFLADAVSSDTIAGLAEQIGADPDILQTTIDRWNDMCAAGIDYEKDRDPETMSAFDGGPYYASPLYPDILNTQGGPRRSARAEVMDVHGNPIPHLYVAGELGGITPFSYQGGFNIAECVVFGQIAGQNAAVVKEELPIVPNLSAVEDDIINYSAYDFANEYVQVDLADNQYLGTSETGIGGVIQVVITMDGNTIADCQVVRETETDMYGGAALQVLPLQVIDANGVDITGVSGATATTNAFKEAVEDALSQARA